MGTVDMLSGHDLVLDADRRFTIEVDAEPANGRKNHIRSAPEAHELYIRDVLLDWAQDEPNELAIERLGPPPATPPLGTSEQAARSAAMMLRSSLNLDEEAGVVETAVSQALAAGHRTRDIARPGENVVGCAEMGDLVAGLIAG